MDPAVGHFRGAGDALAALTYQTLTQRSSPSAEPPSSAEPEPEGEADAWISLSQALPEDTPPALVRTAYAVCVCEPDTDFTFVLELILHGAQELK